MPWLEMDAMQQRVSFVSSVGEGYSMSELCQRYGISRPTGYKWWRRYEQEGIDGLKERSRAPSSCPHKTPAGIEALFVQLRRRHPSWGPVKLRQRAARLHPELVLPAASTIHGLLKRNNLIQLRRKRSRIVHPGRPVVEMTACNDVWTADFKGEFRTGNRRYCYPLTVCDGHSRFLLGCKALYSTRRQGVQPAFAALFRRYGVPRQILTDNGAPFAAPALCGLSRLSVWWIKLGIQPLRIEPGKPQQNPRHERFHWTLKSETTRPPQANLEQQQRCFDSFQHSYNQIRPHQALDGLTPADIYRPSTQPYRTPKSPQYPAHFLVRKVSSSGKIKLDNLPLFLTTTLSGEFVGLDEIDDQVFNVFFGRLLLARFDQKQGKLFP